MDAGLGRVQLPQVMKADLPSDPALLAALLNDPGRIGSIVDRLKANGYRPVPVYGGTKNSGASLKSRYGREPIPTEIFIDEVRAGRGGSIGIMGSTAIGVDIDIENERFARIQETIARDILGDTPLRRVGRAPRLMLIYRPARIISPTELNRFDDTADVRCDGLAFVAFGIHPTTRRPYSWDKGSPLDIFVEELPLVDVNRLQTFLDAIEVVRW